MRVFLDLDMAVLSWEWERYAQYTLWIRQEFCHVPSQRGARGSAWACIVDGVFSGTHKSTKTGQSISRQHGVNWFT